MRTARLPLAAALATVVALAPACAGCGGSAGAEGEGEGDEGEGDEGEGEGEPPPPPPAVCDTPLAARDVTGAVVVTDCTEAGLDAAIAQVTGASGGSIAFACGGPATITVTSQKDVTVDLVVDGSNGGDTVVLDGNNNTRIFHVATTFDQVTPTLTLQHVTLEHGAASGTDLTGGGGAVYREGGALEIIDCTFNENHGNTDGQDTAGGAIFSFGTGPTTIVGSVFTNNTCSNGGALGNLGNDLFVVNSTFAFNSATGTGGNPGNGGNGGTISVDGELHETAICGTHINNSTANAFGGAFFRVAYHGTEPTTFDRVIIQDSHIDDRDPSQGGAIYAQDTVATLRQCSLVSNESRNAGGIFFGPGATVHIENTSFLDNTALSGLGGGIVLNAVSGGDIVNATFSGNSASGEFSFGGAISGDSGPSVEMRNTLVLNSVAGNGFNPISCTTQLTNGAGSFQFPVVRTGGDSDDPNALCSANITVGDVALDAQVVDDEACVISRAPSASSAALGAGTACPAVDAYGNARPADGCTSGAVEVP